MVITRMIDRYVEQVAKQVPIWKRKEIREAVRQTIKEMLTLVCEGEKPTVRDVRHVLQDMGRPSKVARNFLLSTEKKRRMIRRRAAIVADSAVKMLSVVASGMVFLGLALLAIGVSSNLMLFVCGAVLGAIVMIAKMFGPLSDEREEEPGLNQ